MIIDGLLLFTGTSQGAAGGITAGPYVDAPTTGTQIASNIVDLGVVNGIPGSANGGGARDIGTGDNPSLELLATVTTLFAGGTSLQVVLKGAPDNGSGAPGAYTTMWSGPVVVTANLVVGAQLANVTVPRPAPGQPMPRFLAVDFVSVGTHNAGQIETAIVLDRQDQPQGTTGAMSGYPAGLNVAN